MQAAKRLFRNRAVPDVVQVKVLAVPQDMNTVAAAGDVLVVKWLV